MKVVKELPSIPGIRWLMVCGMFRKGHLLHIYRTSNRTQIVALLVR